MKIEKIDTMEALRALQSDWSRLLSQNDTNNIFLTFEWIKSWWEVYGDRFLMYVLVGKIDGSPVGIAPLMISTHPGFVRKCRTIKFIGTPNADYSDFIAPDKAAFIPAVYRYLTGHRKNWDKIDLVQIPETSRTVSEFDTLLKDEKAAYAIDEIETCMAYRYDGNDAERTDFELKQNRTMRKHINFFKKTGELTLERLQTNEEILKYLDGFFVSHISRWNNTPTPSKFLQFDHRLFYQILVRNLAPGNSLRFMLLKHRGRPIAYFFAYVHEKTAYLYTLSYDIFYRKKAPGNILINMMMTDLIRDGYTVIDHTRGAEAYKESFTNSQIGNYRIIVYDRTFDHALFNLRQKLHKSSPIKKLADNPKVDNLKTRFFAYRAHYGIGYIIRAFWKKFLARLIEYKVMLVFEHNNAQLPTREIPPGVTIEQLGEDELDVIASFLGIERSSRKHGVIMKRFANGGECFVARYNGAIAAIAWGLYKEDYLLEMEKYFYLKDNEVILSDAFTSPIFRGLGLHPILLLHRLKRYHQQNRKILTTCLKNNSSSLKGITRTGFSRSSSMRYLKILGIKIL